jgi:hypothetical protein
MGYSAIPGDETGLSRNAIRRRLEIGAETLHAADVGPQGVVCMEAAKD